MVLFTGPLYSGKHDAAKAYAEARGKNLDELTVLEDAQAFFFEHSDETFSQVQLETLAEEYGKADLVLITEVGSGLVPVDPKDRAAREYAGRFTNLLAEQAEEVYRVFCGIPKRLK
ncbi:MAG: bifunctional adenosylcobinamide kinase/adenosylcobinamide-phosphate guanylyltransferase [Clostridia bacterium]|nr:bifunctional adenosylcobinamide kinase/adenosylcobinamide-phosphate guanylyltransferase [Clostridia bacterium]MBQ8469003.1 bifunctional adenosylcobinamide kinase/adenosylcobinamide-phosphate guanylyltransferase [Clostridia bacterium]MBR1705059.1 bifunctional adenosylcobinamide kinase/adenosylcobinamide-phosphate guanylyltransferase [Clostridia bacterium]